MNIADFKSGTYQQQYQYKSFLPAKINVSWVWQDPKINVFLENATRMLGELNAFSHIVPDRCGLVHPDAHRQGSQHVKPD